MSKKILLVDDSTTTLMIEQMILERRTGYRCLTAKNGVEALFIAKGECPDLVLMDVEMPKMNGYDACRLMRQDPVTRETPIILVTSGSKESSVEAGFQSGCNDYIAKPINSGELIKLLQNYLGE